MQIVPLPVQILHLTVLKTFRGKEDRYIATELKHNIVGVQPRCTKQRKTYYVVPKTKFA